MITGGVAKYVEQLMISGAYTKDEMIKSVLSLGSYFIDEAKEMLTPGSTECLVQALKATTAKIQSTIFLNTIFFNLNAQVSVDGNSVCCMFPASEVEGEIGAQHLIPQH